MFSDVQAYLLIWNILSWHETVVPNHWIWLHIWGFMKIGAPSFFNYNKRLNELSWPSICATFHIKMESKFSFQRSSQLTHCLLQLVLSGLWLEIVGKHSHKNFKNFSNLYFNLCLIWSLISNEDRFRLTSIDVPMVISVHSQQITKKGNVYYAVSWTITIFS